MLANLRSKKMEPGLRRFIEAGGPVFGGSAGAIIMGCDIRSCEHADPNDVGLADTTGLGVVDGFTIWCHYKTSDDPMISRLVGDHSHPVLAISERSAIVVAGTEIIALGYDGVVRFGEGASEYVAPGCSCQVVSPSA